jgi:hypothetical protein
MGDQRLKKSRALLTAQSIVDPVSGLKTLFDYSEKMSRIQSNIDTDNTSERAALLVSVYKDWHA